MAPGGSSAPVSMCGYNPHMAARVDRTRTKTCPRCGVVFVPKDWRNTFCSRRCSKLKDLPFKECERCGKVFRKDPDWTLAHWEKRRFCSMACRGNGRPQTVLVCALCRSEFVSGRKRRDKYCSQECYWISLRTERYPVDRRPRREHEFTNKQRRELLRHAGGQCQMCGATENLQADHVVPIWNGGTNALDNGQILCRPCHNQKTRADVLAYWQACSSPPADLTIS